MMMMNSTGGYDDLYALEKTNDGGFVLGGRSTSGRSGEKSESSRGLYDYWVVKLNSIGQIEWDKTVGGSDYDYLRCLQPTSDGGYVMGGLSWSNISADKTESRRGTLFRPDFWVVKLESDGEIEWDKTIGGDDHDGLFSIKEVGKDRYVLAGESSSGISGDKKDVSRGSGDWWIVSLVDKK